MELLRYHKRQSRNPEILNSMESMPLSGLRDKRRKRCYWATRAVIPQEKQEPMYDSPPRNRGDVTITRDISYCQEGPIERLWFLPPSYILFSDQCHIFPKPA